MTEKDKFLMTEKDKNGMYIDVNRMITVSSGHVTEETFNRLMADDFHSLPMPTYVKKMKDDVVGLFIYLEQAYVEPGIMDREEIPEDLQPVIRYALEQDCSILCLDSDGIEMDDVLKVYDW